MANDVVKTPISQHLKPARLESTIDLRNDRNAIEIISVSGDVDIATAPGLYQRLMEAFERRPDELIVDLSQVNFIDATGLGVLVNARQRANSMSAVFKLRLPDGQARFAFEVTGLVAVFDQIDLSAVN